MSTKAALKVIFSGILLGMILCTGWASLHQSMFHWGGLTGPDRYWTVATLFDAYFGFLTFYVWVFHKEAHWLGRVLWFIAIMALGNMGMSAYLLLQLARLRPDQPASDILIPRGS